MLIFVAASVWISVLTGNITAFALESIPLLPRSFCTRPNHVSGTGQLASSPPSRPKAGGSVRPRAWYPQLEDPGSVPERAASLMNSTPSLVPNLLIRTPPDWKQCVPLWRICSGSLTLQSHIFLIISKNIKLNKRSRGRNTRRRMGGGPQTTLNTRSVNNVQTRNRVEGHSCPTTYNSPAFLYTTKGHVRLQCHSSAKPNSCREYRAQIKQGH